MDVETANRHIGSKIRDLRQQNGLTQQELADRSELTKGFISQLENGQVSPSIVTLFDLIECLGTTASEFFKEDVPEQVVHSPEDYFEKIDEAGNSIQWVVPSAQGNQMEPLLVTLAPGSVLPEDLPHSGEEFGYVLSGRVIVRHGGKCYEAAAGESFYYGADKIHALENPSDEEARVIWVSTPPSF